MIRRQWIPAALVAALLVAGCGDDDEGSSGASADGTTTTEQVVVQAADGGDFNPAEIYKDVSPGVVTVISVFEEGEASLLGPAAGQGSGFVVSREGEILTNAHV
ncbi:MAG TPA: S1C family serine protease, partial [Solirubrobacterales bacterium]|nr:S1C family serine protease [Solirubrobacterales bacterium]